MLSILEHPSINHPMRFQPRLPPQINIACPCGFASSRSEVRLHHLARFLLLIPLALLFEMAKSSAAGISPSSPTNHWSFIPPKTSLPPSALPGSTSRNPIDAFVDARLNRLGLEPAPAASRVEWLRRVTYDLSGLAPTRAELEAFLHDSSPFAFERVVDRLLASPTFGERWAQHWLDLAHYADSNGFELDADRPDAWRFRDWVVQAFNQDLPYDRFLQLQVAGDEVAPGDRDAQIASAFSRSGPREVVSGNIDPEVRRQDELVGATTTVGSVFMGLTIGCARCHDHKFDPLSMVDYYQLQACFAGAEMTELPIFEAAEKARFDSETARIRALIKPIEAAKSKLEEPYKARLAKEKEASLTPEERAVRAKPKEQRTPEEQRLFEGTGVALAVKWEEIADAVAQNPADHLAREGLKRQIHDLEIQLPRPLPHIMAVSEKGGDLPETRVLKRGNVKNKMASVQPAPPLVFASHMPTRPQGFVPDRPIDHQRSGRRLQLALWLTDPANPLTARVIVNRLWQHHFGRGLVATSSDFGTRGDRPIDLPLLDWLAHELLRNGWHLKPLHRLMVLSEAYRRSSSAFSPSGLAQDPDNRHLWRMNRRRMEVEGLRDVVLQVSGLLNSKTGGPGVRTYLEPEVRDLIFTEAEVVDLWPIDPDPHEHNRRSLYLHRKRNVHYPMFDAFDAPDAQTPCPQRSISTHAPQALVMLNGSFAQRAARSFAQSLIASSPQDSARIHAAFYRCFARPPSPEEIQWSLDLVRSSNSETLDAWTDFTLALINSNEFLYVP